MVILGMHYTKYISMYRHMTTNQSTSLLYSHLGLLGIPNELISCYDKAIYVELNAATDAINGND